MKHFSCTDGRISENTETVLHAGKRVLLYTAVAFVASDCMRLKTDTSVRSDSALLLIQLRQLTMHTAAVTTADH